LKTNFSKRARRWVILGAAVAVSVTYLWLFGDQTFLAFEARAMARTLPFVKEIPVELSDSSVSLAPGRKLSYFGYEFEIPWDDVDDSKCRIVGGNKAIIAFLSGNVLSLWSWPPHEFANGVLSSIKMDPQKFRQLYGDAALQSDYTFHRIMLGMTPDKVFPFTSKRQAHSDFALLLSKGISGPPGALSGIYSVKAGEFRGFQFGRPQSSPGSVSIELYSDSTSLDFIFGQKANGSTVISQADINRILVTLRKSQPDI